MSKRVERRRRIEAAFEDFRRAVEQALTVASREQTGAAREHARTGLGAGGEARELPGVGADRRAQQAGHHPGQVRDDDHDPRDPEHPASRPREQHAEGDEPGDQAHRRGTDRRQDHQGRGGRSATLAVAEADAGPDQPRQHRQPCDAGPLPDREPLGDVRVPAGQHHRGGPAPDAEVREQSRHSERERCRRDLAPCHASNRSFEIRRHHRPRSCREP